MGGPDHPSSRPRQVARFWGGLGGGLALAYPLMRPLLAVGYQRYDAQAGAGLAMLTPVNSALHFLAAAPWILLLVVAAAALVELALVRVRTWRSVPAIFGRLVVAIAS